MNRAMMRLVLRRMFPTNDIAEAHARVFFVIEEGGDVAFVLKLVLVVLLEFRGTVIDSLSLHETCLRNLYSGVSTTHVDVVQK
jgi:hypothetical protein